MITVALKEVNEVEEITEFEIEVGEVSKQSGLSQKEIEEKVAERKKKTHGLLTNYGALYAIAKEMGIDLNQNTIMGRLGGLEKRISALERKVGCND